MWHKKQALRIVFLFLALLRYAMAQPAGFPVKGASFPAEYARGNTTYLIRGEITPLLFHLYGDRSKVDNPKIVMELPAGVKPVYAFHTGRESLAPIELHIGSAGAATDPGRYEIPLDEARLKQHLPDRLWVFDPTSLAVFLEPEDAAAQTSEIRWHITGRTGRGEAKTVNVKVLPALETAKEQSGFRLYFYVAHLLRVPDKEIRNRLLSLYEKTGIRGGLNYHPDVPKHSPEVPERFELYSEASFGGWGGGYWGVSASILAEGLSINPQDILAVLNTGEKTKQKNAICQTWAIENEEYFVKKYSDGLKKLYFSGITKGFLNNFEIPYASDITWRKSCFCDRCKSAFVKHATLNIGADALSAEEMLTTHKQRWINFRYWQNGQMVRLFDRAVKKVNPQLPSVLCSIPVPENRETSYHPIDAAEYDEYVDEHWPMFYEQSPETYTAMDRETNLLKKPVLPTLNTCYPINEYNTWPAELVRLNTIAAASTGSRGVCYFTGDISADGQYLHAINRANNELAQTGKFFFDGERTDAFAQLEHLPWKTAERKGRKTVFPDMRNFVFHNIHKTDDGWLMAVFNYHIESPAFVKISFPDIPSGRYMISEPVGKRCLSGSARPEPWNGRQMAEGLHYKIPPRDVRFLLVQPYNRQAEAMQFAVLQESAVRREWESLKNRETESDDSGLLAHWNFDGYPDGIQLKGAEIVKGKQLNALRFSGNRNYAKILDAAVADPIKNEFTIEMWIYPESFSESHSMRFIVKQGSFGLWWYQPTNVLAFDIYNNGDRKWLDSRNFLKEKQWNHLVATYSGGYMRLYHNGAEIISHFIDIMTVDKSEHPLTLSSEEIPFKGMMGGVKLFNRGLDGREIWENYVNAGSF